MVLVSVLALWAAVTAPSKRARADDGEVNEAREHFKSGASAFFRGEYEAAIQEYTTAYRLKKDPALLFDLGQAHKAAGHPAEALRFFKQYLIDLPAAMNRAEVEAKIASLEAIAKDGVAATAPSNLPATNPVTPAPTQTAPTTISKPKEHLPSPKPLYRRWWLWTAIGGAVAVGIGVGLGVAFAPGPSAPALNPSAGTFRF
jgi:hypothetical protein